MKESQFKEFTHVIALNEAIDEVHIKLPELLPENNTYATLAIGLAVAILSLPEDRRDDICQKLLDTLQENL